MISFSWLVFAHFMGDIGFQNPWLVKKKQHWFYMVAHSVIYTGCIAVSLEYLGILVIWKVLFIVIGHYLIDTGKKVLPERYKDLIDQSLHLIQLIIVYYL